MMVWKSAKASRETRLLASSWAIRARQRSEETIAVSRKWRRANVVSPPPAGPQSTTRDGSGTRTTISGDHAVDQRAWCRSPRGDAIRRLDPPPSLRRPRAVRSVDVGQRLAVPHGIADFSHQHDADRGIDAVVLRGPAGTQPQRRQPYRLRVDRPDNPRRPRLHGDANRRGRHPAGGRA